MAELWSSFTSDRVNPADLTLRIFDSGAACLLATESQAVVGFACYSLIRSPLAAHPVQELWAVYVDARHRRRGIARALVEEALTAGTRAGARRIFVTSANTDVANAFYTEIGFRCVASRWTAP